mmetsp:Transcript_31213/g.74192  ORF Transcript_31213/g.74192 Transcript_31213/m.74192 type:complete len:213 (+) Transcript_31213:458-1096(+)
MEAGWRPAATHVGLCARRRLRRCRGQIPANRLGGDQPAGGREALTEQLHEHHHPQGDADRAQTPRHDGDGDQQGDRRMERDGWAESRPLHRRRHSPRKGARGGEGAGSAQCVQRPQRARGTGGDRGVKRRSRRPRHQRQPPRAEGPREGGKRCQRRRRRVGPRGRRARPRRGCAPGLVGRGPRRCRCLRRARPRAAAEGQGQVPPLLSHRVM